MDVYRENKYFQHFVAQLETYSDLQLRGLRKIYGFKGMLPEQLAEEICVSPQRVVEVVERELATSESWSLLQDLVYDHDIVLPLERGMKRAAKELEKFGLIIIEDDVVMLNGLMAAILAPLMSGTPTSTMVLLGITPIERLRSMARWWNVTAESHMALILSLGERMGDVGVILHIVDRLPDVEYLGPAMLAVELGGVCFWQEVFGFDEEEDRKVVPLMRRDDRAIEKEMADVLQDAGVIFRVHEGSQSMLVVPEEYWPDLWQIGCTWLMDWVTEALEGLGFQGARRTEEMRFPDFQSTLKWLMCEFENAPAYWNGGPSPESLSHCVEVGQHDPEYWAGQLRLASEVGSLLVQNNQVTSNPAFESVVDLPRQVFIRQMVHDWVMGYLGAETEHRVGQALGLDDVWRLEVLKLLRSKNEFVPVWMHSEGIESGMTGSGFLKDSLETTPEVLHEEFMLLHETMWSMRMLWLDLLSMLNSDYWYPLEQITELFQMTACLEVFSRVEKALGGIEMPLYIPIQRSSLLMEPVHTEDFGLWVEDLFSKLFQPLGVAVLSQDKKHVMFDTSVLRIPTPAGLLDTDRVEMLRLILQNPELEFRIQASPELRLHRVPSGKDAMSIDLDVPLQTVRAWLKGRRIRKFDGKRLYLQS